ncbi:tetratricopeptide repeat protein, partial [Escherichia coli]|uniref:tetratricopeptide repeat protein n=1 Tax=Escherichia coli TaxID=562 RepID=UPI001F394BDD
YILDSLGWAYYYNKEYKKSIQCLQLAAQLLPFESEVIEHLGDAYWKNKDKTQAQYEWHNAINISKDKNNIERLNQKLI